MEAYRWTDELCADSYERLIRDDGSEVAILTEPEDRSSHRDIKPITTELNWLAARLAAAERRAEDAERDLLAVGHALGICIEADYVHEPAPTEAVVAEAERLRRLGMEASEVSVRSVLVRRAERRAEALHEALREREIRRCWFDYVEQKRRIKCDRCGGGWYEGQREVHAAGCLAAPSGLAAVREGKDGR